jgi:tetratricopeptide (TPR) repeat protein
MVMGHFVTGLSFFVDGDFQTSIDAHNKAVQTAADPFYSQFSRFSMGIGYTLNRQFQEAEEALQEVASYSRDFGCETLGTPAHALLGLVSIAKGQMGQGLKMIEKTLRACHENERRSWYATIEHALGQVYLQIVEKTAPVSLTTMAKNVGFILKNVPSAGKKAEDHFNKAIEAAKEIGAKGTLGQAYLDLGRLHKAKGRSDQARECFIAAVEMLEECQSQVFLKQAKEALTSSG